MTESRIVDAAQALCRRRNGGPAGMHSVELLGRRPTDSHTHGAGDGNQKRIVAQSDFDTTVAEWPTVNSASVHGNASFHTAGRPRRIHSMSVEAERLNSRSSQAGLNDGRRVEIKEPLQAQQPNEPSSPRSLVYAIVGLLLLLYMGSWVAFTSVYEPNLQFFAYYAVDYSHGFVRRGLGGEILDLFPANLYFTGLLILRWLVPALFGVGIAAVAWTVAVRFGRSERLLMLALLTPILPLGFVHAVVLPTPDLVGESVLAVFAVVLASAKRDRSLLIASGTYGMTTAVLTLIHEAVPFLQALGAILAILVLAHGSVKMKRLSALLAVAPGLVVALTIALLRRRDVSSQCARLPHKAFRWAPGQTLSGERAYTDYHDWTCRFITVTTRRTPFIGPS